MENNLKKLILLSVGFCGVLHAQDNPAAQRSREKVRTVSIAGQDLPINTAVQLVLRSNLTLRNERYNVLMSDTPYAIAGKPYAPVLNLETNYIRNATPVVGISFLGDLYTEYNASASVSKKLETGTNVTVGVTQKYFRYDERLVDRFVDNVPPLNQPFLFVSLQQELLKNSFGYIDRRSLEIEKKKAALSREALVNQLSALVVEALINYWNVTIAKAAVSNAELELASTRNVRAIIARNIGLGLAENFDLNQYNALVNASESKLALKKQEEKESIRALLRTVNLPPDTDVSGVTELIDWLPVLDTEASLKAADQKRVDLKQARIQVDLAQKELELSESNSLPSLKFRATARGLGQDSAIISANQDVFIARYPNLEVGLVMSVPLGDPEVQTKERDAGFKLEQAKIKLQDLQNSVRDEVIGRVERVKLSHEVLEKAKASRIESERYYNNLLVRSRQGRFNSVQVKNALDSMIDSRQRELEALVNYNISLLQLDLSRNEVFERYEVDVEKIIAEVK